MKKLAKKEAEEVAKKAKEIIDAKERGEEVRGGTGTGSGPMPPVAAPTTTALDPSKMAPLRVVVVNTKMLAEG